MRKHVVTLITVIFLILNSQAIYAQEYELKSPDGSITISLVVNNNISYNIRVDEEQVLNPSVISMTIEPDNILGKNVKVIKVENTNIDEMLYPQLKVKSKEIRNHYNETRISFEGNYTVEIFKDGVNADRYAGDYKKIIKQINNKDVFQAELAPGGGWNAIITKD